MRLIGTRMWNNICAGMPLNGEMVTFPFKQHLIMIKCICIIKNIESWSKI
jgi:hypothetical protein